MKGKEMKSINAFLRQNLLIAILLLMVSIAGFGQTGDMELVPLNNGQPFVFGTVTDEILIDYADTYIYYFYINEYGLNMYRSNDGGTNFFNVRVAFNQSDVVAIYKPENVWQDVPVFVELRIGNSSELHSLDYYGEELLLKDRIDVDGESGVIEGLKIEYSLSDSYQCFYEKNSSLYYVEYKILNSGLIYINQMLLSAFDQVIHYDLVLISSDYILNIGDNSQYLQSDIKSSPCFFGFYLYIIENVVCLKILEYDQSLKSYDIGIKYPELVGITKISDYFDLSNPDSIKFYSIIPFEKLLIGELGKASISYTKQNEEYKAFLSNIINYDSLTLFTSYNPKEIIVPSLFTFKDGYISFYYNKESERYIGNGPFVKHSDFRVGQINNFFFVKIPEPPSDPPASNYYPAMLLIIEKNNELKWLRFNLHGRNSNYYYESDCNFLFDRLTVKNLPSYKLLNIKDKPLIISRVTDRDYIMNPNSQYKMRVDLFYDQTDFKFSTVNFEIGFTKFFFDYDDVDFSNIKIIENRFIDIPIIPRYGNLYRIVIDLENYWSDNIEQSDVFKFLSFSQKYIRRNENMFMYREKI